MALKFVIYRRISGGSNQIKSGLGLEAQTYEINCYLQSLDDYVIVDWILGEEGAATSSFDEKEKTLVQDYIINGGRLFVSGSEIPFNFSTKRFDAST